MLKNDDSDMDISWAYEDLKNYITCITQYNKYVKENPKATQTDIDNERRKVNNAVLELLKYIDHRIDGDSKKKIILHDWNKKTNISFEFNLDDFLNNNIEVMLKDDKQEYVKPYKDKLQLLKKFVRKNNDNKNVFAIQFINKIIWPLLGSKNTERIEGEDIDRLYDLNILYLVKCLYTLLYGEYNDDLVIDALLDGGVSSALDSKHFSCYITEHGLFDDYEISEVSGSPFRIYCMKKLATLIKNNKQFLEKFFEYFFKNGIDIEVLKYLLTNGDTKHKIKDYILKNNICILSHRSKAYALNTSPEAYEQSKLIQQLARESGRYGKTHFHISVNGFGSFCHNAIQELNDMPSEQYTLLLPYAFGEEKGEKRRNVCDKYKKILEKIFRYKKAVSRNNDRIDITMEGVSNGTFITADMAVFIANTLGLDIEKIRFTMVPLHVLGSLGNLGVRNIQDAMNNVRDKSKVKSIAISGANSNGGLLFHPQRKARQLAQKLADIGYDNIEFCKHNNSSSNVDYRYVNSENRDKNIKKTILNICKDKDFDGKTRYFRYLEDVYCVTPILDQEQHFKILWCKAKDVKNLHNHNKYNKVQQIFKKKFQDNPGEYLHYFNCVPKVNSHSGIHIVIAEKEYIYKHIQDGAYILYPIKPAKTNEKWKPNILLDVAVELKDNLEKDKNQHMQYKKLENGAIVICYRQKIQENIIKTLDRQEDIDGNKDINNVKSELMLGPLERIQPILT